MTFLDFKAKIIGLIFPDSQPENLVIPHANMFQEAMADIQHWVPEEREDNVDVIPFCQTNFRSGLTIVAAPRGNIKRVFTVANGNWGDPVYYNERGVLEPESWSRNLLTFTRANNDGLPGLPMGFQLADASTDSKCGRARTGIWSRQNRNIVMAPWLQSNESLVIVWDGIKDAWADTDIVLDKTNFAIDLAKVVKLYVAFAHERDFGAGDRLVVAKGAYEEARADLIHEWREFTRRKEDITFADERNRTAEEIAATQIPTSPAVNVFAAVGGYASGDANETAVAALIATWDPAFVIADSGAAVPYQTYVTPFYGNYVVPYSETCGTCADNGANAFFPVAGKADWDSHNLADWLVFFNPPDGAPFYKMCRCGVSVFFMDSDTRQVDGVTAGSVQALRLKADLARSTARWNIVVMERPPYSSSNDMPSQADVQWPFDLWGADLVISGGSKTYERLSLNGVTYIVNGLGGAGSLGTFGSPLASSQARYAAAHGALRLETVGSTLVLAFYSTDGTIQDTVTLTKV